MITAGNTLHLFFGLPWAVVWGGMGGLSALVELGRSSGKQAAPATGQVAKRILLTSLATALLPLATAHAGEKMFQLRGEVRDARSDKPLPCRIYVAGQSDWHFAKSASPAGSAVEYRKQRNAGVEMHTTLSAHPFLAELPPGKYTILVERGKEYLPESQTVQIADQDVSLTFKLRRWINMAELGWYSGDTHTHRTLEELPNVILAEDLNVALPLTSWVTHAYQSPQGALAKAAGQVRRGLIRVDATHVIYPLNTEWEIFTVDKKRHTLGAVFTLGHEQPIPLGVPPVKAVAAEARRQGALLDLDKHNWPWSMMLVPVMNVDLFELANNHVWRDGGVGFPQFNNQYVPEYMQLDMPEGNFTEASWIDFGFQNYYALLNCGFRMRPTAGTASGVHPVPLGFGRVYVELTDGFDYNAWMKGLDAGRSFVSTGPMLFVRANEQPAGHTFTLSKNERPTCHMTGSAESGVPLGRIEVVVNGRVAMTIEPANERTDLGGYRSPIDVQLEQQVAIDGSFWVALRCFEKRPAGQVRFAHTSPFHFDVEGRPLHPRREETAYLVRRVEEELARHKDVLPESALAEYRQALAIYRRLHKMAK